MAQKVIRTEYSDGKVVLSNIRNNKGFPVFRENDTVTATKVTQWYDGSVMSPDKADGKVYLRYKATGEYFLVNLPNWGELFLEKDTMAEMRGLSLMEILLLKAGYYKGVRLNGYYAKNDTPGSIEYVLSSTSDADDGGSVIEVGGVKLEHKFVDVINTIYFGLNEGLSLSPYDVRMILHKTFTRARLNSIPKTIINKGLHITESPAVNFNVEGGVLEFEGILKLKDNDSVSGGLSSCGIINYPAGNVTVINQRLDGNRDKQVHNPQIGTQFTFTSYGENAGIKFIGGWCINSIQSHCQFVKDSVTFEDYLLQNSGEHGIYYSKAVDGPAGKFIKLTNVKIIDNGHLSGGSCVTTRAVKMGYYTNCEFNNGTTPKGGQTSGVSIYYAYRGVVTSPEEEFKHYFDGCTFKTTVGSTIYNIGCRPDSNTPDPLTVQDHMDVGQGAYLNNCTLDGVIGQGVIEFNYGKISPPEDNVTQNVELPRKIQYSTIENFYEYRPTESRKLHLIGNRIIEKPIPNDRILFDNGFNTDSTKGAEWVFESNDFVGFNTPHILGIIRFTNAAQVDLGKIIVNGNRLINCGVAVFANFGDTKSAVAVNNSDVSKSGVKLRFSNSTTPKLIANNDFIPTEGTVAQRPSTPYIYPGQMYYNMQTNVMQRWDGSLWQPINRESNATPSVKGLVNQMAAISDISTPDATDEATAIALANANKLKTKQLLEALRTAGILAR